MFFAIRTSQMANNIHESKIFGCSVLIDNSQPQSPITRVFHKKTLTGLLTNYFSFTPFSYKLGLIRTLFDRTYKINNTWKGFNEDIKKLLLILRKNLLPSHIVERVIRQYITKTQTLSNSPARPPSNSTHFFKLPYVGPFSIVAQNRLRKLLKRYCNNLDVKLAFSSFKIRNSLVWRTLCLLNFVRMLFTSSLVQAVILALSAKLADTSRHAFANT